MSFETKDDFYFFSRRSVHVLLIFVTVNSHSHFLFQSCENCIVCWKPQEKFEAIFKGVRGLGSLSEVYCFSGGRKALHRKESLDCLKLGASKMETALCSETVVKFAG